MQRRISYTDWFDVHKETDSMDPRFFLKKQRQTYAIAIHAIKAKAKAMSNIDSHPVGSCEFNSFSRPTFGVNPKCFKAFDGHYSHHLS